MKDEQKQYYRLIGLTLSLLITINLIDHQTKQQLATTTTTTTTPTDPHSKPFTILLLVIWLGFLFSFVGIVASDFFCPNLSTISLRLGLSENLAGVTLLGFGNGAPDVFSTYAAIKANTGSLAIGELIGAASFIVSVVVGSMAIIRPFKVPRHSFLRDIAFFIIAIIFVLIIIYDQVIHRWQANTLILLYLIYVAAVLLSSWSVERKRIKLDQLQIARSQYSHDDQLLEPYLDHPDFPIQPTPEEDSDPLIPELNQSLNSNPMSRSSASSQLGPPPSHRPSAHRCKTSSSAHSQDSFKSLIESSAYPLPAVRQRRMRAPSLSYRAGPGVNPLGMASPNHSFSHPPAMHSSSSQDGLASPELNRRRRRSTMVINPIRPSLLGAIEFRDVVNSLARESNGRISPQLGHSSSQGRRSRSTSIVPDPRPSDLPGRRFAYPIRSDSDRPRRKTEFALPESDSGLPSRTVSSGHRLTQSQGSIIPPTPSPWQLPNRADQQSIIDLSSDQDSTFTPSDHSLSSHQPLPPSSQTIVSSLHRAVTPLPSILITSDRQEILALPDSPDHSNLQAHQSSTHHHHHHNHHHLTRLDRYRRWKMIGRTVWDTLFPTLKDWKIKSLLGKIIAIVSSPAVFLLTLTLPVVDETAEDAEDQEELGPDDAQEEEEECRLGLALGAENRRVLDGLEDTANGREGAQDGADRGRPCRPDSPQQPATRRSSSSSSSNQEEAEESRREGHPVSYPMVDVGPGSGSASLSLDPRPALAVLSAARISPDNPAHPIVDPGLLDRSSSSDTPFSDHHVARLLATVQSFLSPIFWKICLQNNEDQGPSNPDHHSTSLPKHFGGADQGRKDVVVIFDRFSLTYDNLLTLGTIVGGLVLSKLVYVQLRPTEEGNNGKMKIGLCVLGFVNSMLWILSIVDQVIQVLAQLAKILHIDNAVLGLTIFGVGNSLGDLVANLTLAKMGFPVMAISACFGGPLLNILLGIGLSSSVVMTTRGTSQIGIESSKSLLVCAASLLCILLGLLVVVPLWNHYMVDRAVGVCLIFAYSCVFIVVILGQIFF
ncbi:hypothetical protein PGT21_023231 [Puccinia graminis f. sp. tritici]|uniref:Sodium/calcium exchanger membrane region domain-containing protein n=1 Tax=Puccinia graminis f. sp. tritici TaxID=56615 RepID=A0A5B0NCX8_PUCGR|nr:hypothetical protein PGT21_023231 [Puccinia graminis f. sp. tritici]